MPSINPTQLRAHAETLARQGRIDQEGVQSLIDTALGDDATLDPALQVELQKILVDFKDKIEPDVATRKLSSFLDIKDRDIQALSRRSEKNDGVIRASEGRALVNQAGADGNISKDEQYSLAAVLVGSTMTSAARAHIAEAAGLKNVDATRSANTEIPKGGTASDQVTIDVDGDIASVEIDVAISHERRGDLSLQLVSPDGTSVMLSDRQGRTKDDIRGSYPSTLRPKESLDALLGKSAKGPWTLVAVDHAGKHVGTIEHWSLNIGVRASSTTGTSVHSFTPAGFDRPAHLSSTGHVTLHAGQESPATLVERGDALFHLADLIDDSKENPLKNAAMTLSSKRALFEKLSEGLAMVSSSTPEAPGLNEAQTLQMRSSSVTVMLALMESLGGSSDDVALKREVFAAYRDVLNTETNPSLRDSMTFHLRQAAQGLPADLRTITNEIVETIAPLKPAYDDWFKDGNRTLRVSWATGSEEEFSLGTMKLLEKKGFAKADPARTTPPLVYTKTVNGAGGEPHTIEVHVKVNRNDIFKSMDDDKFHIVGYDGHSDIGRNIPASLRSAPSSTDKKLVFFGLCAGKDSIHSVREQYPDSQVLTTFNSSYFNTGTENGKTIMTRSENFNVLMELVDGAVKRDDWSTMNTNIKDRAVLYKWNHVMPGGTNYISPVHTDIRRKVLDTDHDGQADVLDKLVSFNTYRVAEETSREFSPRDPGRKADLLDGTRTHMAAMALNTATGYNSEAQAYKKQNIIGAGYFDAAPGEKQIIKFARETVEGESVLKMTVNSQFAHMSVEALRAIAHYEFFMTTGGERNLSDVDQKLMGLVFAAFSLNYDEARWGRDENIWQGMLTHLGLPTDIPYSAIRSILDEEHHDYSGNKSHITKWKESIPPAALEALKTPPIV